MQKPLDVHKEQGQSLIDYSKEELEQIYRRLNHDLRRDVSNIESLSDMLSSEYKEELDDNFNEVLKHIKDCCHRISQTTHFVNTLYNISIREPKFSKNSLSSIFTEIRDKDLSLLLKEKNATITFDDEEILIKSDRELLKKAFKELIKNGIIYNKSSNPSIRIQVEKNKNNLQCILIDNGVGYEEKKKKDSTFFKINSTGIDSKGRGSGLSLAKKILKSHNCHLTIGKNSIVGTTAICDFKV